MQTGSPARIRISPETELMKRVCRGGGSESLGYKQQRAEAIQMLPDATRGELTWRQVDREMFGRDVALDLASE
ncbi:unnamed protein product [Caretta caretta]